MNNQINEQLKQINEQLKNINTYFLTKNSTNEQDFLIQQIENKLNFLKKLTNN